MKKKRLLIVSILLIAVSTILLFWPSNKYVKTQGFLEIDGLSTWAVPKTRLVETYFTTENESGKRMYHRVYVDSSSYDSLLKHGSIIKSAGWKVINLAVLLNKDRARIDTIRIIPWNLYDR